jgi:thiamine-phosphate pyrophosphorylase
LRKFDQFIVCYVTDRRSLEMQGGSDCESSLVQQIRSAAGAGVDWVQIREKDLGTRQLADLTRSAVQICQRPGEPQKQERTGTRIIVNDRLDVAYAAGAKGTHAGENSLPVEALIEARRVLGLHDFLIGASCHSLEGAMETAASGGDYIFFGPVFATPSKERFGPPQGITKLGEVCKGVSIPVIAIGGITAENAAVCREAGAAGIAAIRLFQESSDAGEIVRRLHRS